MNVTTILIGALVFVACVAGAGWKGYGLGQDDIRAEYAARDLAAANEAAEKTRQLEEKYRAQEQAHSQAVAQIANDYEGKLTDAQRKTTMALDAIRSGSVRLRDPGSKACGSVAAETPASPSRRNGASDGGLSNQASEFLLSLAAEADRNTLQLGACQAVLEADRR